MKTIIKIEAEWNNSHCSLDNVDYDLPGWAELPERFKATWEADGPFVAITASDSGEITGMTKTEEIVPEPTPESEKAPDVWDEMAGAIKEGVNAV